MASLHVFISDVHCSNDSLIKEKEETFTLTSAILQFIYSVVEQ